MKVTRFVVSLLMTLLLVIGLAACGGGSDAGPPAAVIATPLPSPPPPAPPQLPPAPPSPFPAPTSASPYFLASGKAGDLRQGSMPNAASGLAIQSGHLVVVDPASPTTPVALEAAGHWQSLAEFKEGVIDNVAGSVSNLSTRFLAYLKNRRVHRLDLRRGNWPPAPALVSSLMTDQICGHGARAIHDRQTPEHSWLLFAEPGPDRACNAVDDRQLAVRLDMSEPDSPLIIDSEVVGVLRTATGAITGFVIRKGSQIQKVDASFANAIDLFTVTGGRTSNFFIETLEVASMLPGRLLFVEANQLRTYDISSGNGPVTLFAPAPGEFCCYVATTDAANDYLIVNGDRSARLIRVTDALAVDVLASEAGSRIYTTIATPTRLVYSTIDASGVLYRSVPKAGGTPITIAPVVPCPDLSSAFVAGENVWYDCGPLGFWDYGGWLEPPRGLPARPFVGVVRSDGSQAQEFDDALIARTASASPLPLRPDASTIYAITVKHNQAQSTNKTLRAYEGATRNQLVEYAALPINLPFLDVWQLATSGQPATSVWTLPTLLTATALSGVSVGPTDLFFFQSDAAGMTRVTAFAP